MKRADRINIDFDLRAMGVPDVPQIVVGMPYRWPYNAGPYGIYHQEYVPLAKIPGTQLFISWFCGFVEPCPHRSHYGFVKPTQADFEKAAEVVEQLASQDPMMWQGIVRKAFSEEA